MGNVTSQELLGMIHQRHCSLNEAFKHPVIQDYIRQAAWQESDQNTKDFLFSLFPKRDRLKPLFNIDLIVLSQTQKSLILHWASNLRDCEVFGLARTPLDIYRALQELSKPRPDDEATTFFGDIRRRLQYCVFYLIRNQWRTVYGPSSFNDAIRPLLHQQEQELVNDEIMRWTRPAQTLFSLAKALGGYGVLLVLPPQLPRTVLEIHVNSKSARFTEVVRHLESLCIKELAEDLGANQAVDNILSCTDHLDQLEALIAEDLPQ